MSKEPMASTFRVRHRRENVRIVDMLLACGVKPGLRSSSRSGRSSTFYQQAAPGRAEPVSLLYAEVVKVDLT
jgi:hypothetical protein